MNYDMEMCPQHKGHVSVCGGVHVAPTWKLTRESTYSRHTLEYDLTDVPPVQIRGLKLRPYKFVMRTDGGVAASRYVVGRRIMKNGREATTHSPSIWAINPQPEWLQEIIKQAEDRARQNGWIQ